MSEVLLSRLRYKKKGLYPIACFLGEQKGLIFVQCWPVVCNAAWPQGRFRP